MSLSFTLPRKVLITDYDFYSFCLNNIPNVQITSPYDIFKVELNSFDIILKIKLKSKTFEFLAEVKYIEIKSNHSGLYGSYEPLINIYTQDNINYSYSDFSKKWLGSDNLDVDYDIYCESQEIIKS